VLAAGWHTPSVPTFASRQLHPDNGRTAGGAFDEVDGASQGI
jgi:hypothetical protein